MTPGRCYVRSQATDSNRSPFRKSSRATSSAASSPDLANGVFARLPTDHERFRAEFGAVPTGDEPRLSTRVCVHRQHHEEPSVFAADRKPRRLVRPFEVDVVVIRSVQPTDGPFDLRPRRPLDHIVVSRGSRLTRAAQLLYSLRHQPRYTRTSGVIGELWRTAWVIPSEGSGDASKN